MFTFKAIELLNWDWWAHVRLPLDEDVVLVAGPNGSGKTTFLDAIRVLLNATRLSTSRKLPQYLREDTGVALVKAVVDNTHRKGVGRRPFAHLGLFGDVATLACLIERHRGSWERRYLIVDGDPPIEQLRTATGSLKPMEFSRELETAGVPRTLLRILALEQGETHKLAERSPEQLLEYVLEMQGDKAALERYDEARGSYLASQRELADYEEKLTGVRLHVDALKKDAESYQRFVELAEAERQVREEKLPAARVASLRSQLTAAEEDVDRTRRAVADADGVLGSFHRESGELTEGAATIRAEVERRKSTYQQVIGAKERLDLESRDLRRWAAEYEESGASQGDVDVDELLRERERLLESEASLRAELNDLIQRIGKLRGERESLDRDAKRQPPDWVERMMRELRGADIEASLVADLIEIADEHWHVAVESVLGRERFTILVDPKDTAVARKMAQRQRYRCYVSDYGRGAKVRARPRSALSVVRLNDDRVPEAVLRMLDSVQLVETVDEGLALGRGETSITPDGYRQDSRGGIFVGQSELYCGAGAGSHRKGRIDEELGEMRGRRDSLQRSLEPSQLRLRQIDERLAAAKARERLLGRVGDPATLQARIAVLDGERREASERLMGLLQEIDDANRQLVERERRLSLLEYRHREALIERDRNRSAMTGADARRERIAADLRDAETRLPESMRHPAAMELLEPEVVLIERQNSLRQRMAAWTGPRDGRAVMLWQKAHAELIEAERSSAARRKELDTSTEELTLARRAYVRVVEETIRRYRRNVLRLGELCRVDVRVTVPGADALREDAEGLVGRVGLEVRVGFDGKRVVAVHDPELSGGQRVVSSLILLMALTMNDDGDTAGFFILDEPFAHLSVERIDEVARFLHVTKAQFLITTPTTHNLLVYNPAGLTLNLRKKPAQQRFAPVPTFLRRDQPLLQTPPLTPPGST